MVNLIIIFACFLLFAGIILIVKPDVIFEALGKNIDNTTVQIMAVCSRLLIGYLLIVESSGSKFPNVVGVLGWIFIAAGLFLGLIGRNRFRRLISWVLDTFRPFGRLAGVVAVVFGGFLVYVFQ